jgi:diguanylate cyclase (GGDEF)-like protein/PAS domain S-box-containing protein
MSVAVANAWSAGDAIENEQFFRVCVDAMMEGLVLQDACGNIRFCNRSAEQILGATAEQLRLGILPSSFQTSIDEAGKELSGARSPFNQALRTGKSVEGVIMGIRRPDGELRWVQVNVQPVFDKAVSEPTAAVATFVDITSRKDAERQMNDQLEQIRCLNAMMKLQMRELENANAQLEALAAHDGLTGLKNHRAFHERLASEVARAARSRTPLSVILLDVDHFKLYNDTFGHPAGDTVLRQLAQILNENARISDVVARPRAGRGRGECTIARHGGEEFAVILPNADATAAMKVAERLRAAIQKAEWPHRPVTASFGVASLSPEIADQTALIAAADKALYRSKTRGRNRVTCAPGSRAQAAN